MSQVEWIPVTKALPIIIDRGLAAVRPSIVQGSRKVLFSNMGGFISVGWVQLYRGNAKWRVSDTRLANSVTHWAELPAPPTGEN